MLDLLFTLCTWHALAKLRLHTLSTLQIFKSTTELLLYYFDQFGSHASRCPKNFRNVMEVTVEMGDYRKSSSSTKKSQKSSPERNLYTFCLPIRGGLYLDSKKAKFK